MPELYELHPPREQASVDLQPFHTWLAPDGSPWTEFYRFPDHYLLRFPGMADFTVSNPDLDVACHPLADVSRNTVDHLYLNQVLPLVRSKRGELVFHASAVVIDGLSVAFLAESGRGKSTLAAAFALAGHPFLTDDGLVVEARGDGFFVLPSHPSIRLWSDSEQALMAPGAARARPLPYTPKSRFLASDALPFHDRAVPLGCAYFLGDGQAGDVTMEPIKPSDAMIEWVKHSFLLDIQEQPRIASHFGQVGALARRCKHFRLDYPRSYGQLTRVMDAIIGQVREARGRTA